MGKISKKELSIYSVFSGNSRFEEKLEKELVKKAPKGFRVFLGRLQWTGQSWHTWVAQEVSLSEKQFEEFYKDLKPKWKTKLKTIKKERPLSHYFQSFKQAEKIYQKELKHGKLKHERKRF